MDANISNFQKYIIRKIVKSVEYNVQEDDYIFNRCDLSDDLIAVIVQEGERYGMSETDVRQYITLTANNIKTQPVVEKVITELDYSKVSFGQHLRIEINHPQKGLQWVEGIKFSKSLYILSSSVEGLDFGVCIIPQTTIWSVPYYIDFSYKKNNDYSSIKNLILRLGELTSVQFYSPSVVYDILDSSCDFSQNDPKNVRKNTKKVSQSERETELLTLIDVLEEIIGSGELQKYYEDIKSKFITHNLSSYLLNVLIHAIKNKSVNLSSQGSYDESFFIYTDIGGDAKQIEWQNILTRSKNKHNEEIRKRDRKEGWFITIIIFLCLSLLAVFYDDLVNTEALREEVSSLEKQCVSLKTNINTVGNYSFIAGATPRYNSRCDGSWVMCIEAKQDVFLESFYVRGAQTGNVVIEIYDNNDFLVRRISSWVQSTFTMIQVNVNLPNGNYYIRRRSGVELQYHDSSSNEYSRFNGGALQITGCCHYDNRHTSRTATGYYQYFYNIKYHLKF